MSQFDIQQPVYTAQSVNRYSSGHGAVKTNKARKRLRLGFIIFAIIAVVLTITLCWYFFFLPDKNNTNYFSTVKPAYNQQVSQIELLYSTVKYPVFTEVIKNQQLGAQDLLAVKATIQAAVSSTNKLTSVNSFSVLPGSDWQSSVVQTNKKFIAMEQYVNDSKSFLTDYLDFVNFAQKFQYLASNSNLTAFYNSMKQINAASTPAQLYTATSNTINTLSATINSLRALNTPLDLQQESNNEVNNLISANNDYIDILVGVNNDNPAQLHNSIVQCNEAEAKVKSFANSYIANSLATSSPVLTDIARLEAEHPLTNS